MSFVWSNISPMTTNFFYWNLECHSLTVQGKPASLFCRCWILQRTRLKHKRRRGNHPRSMTMRMSLCHFAADLQSCHFLRPSSISIPSNGNWQSHAVSMGDRPLGSNRQIPGPFFFHGLRISPLAEPAWWTIWWKLLRKTLPKLGLYKCPHNERLFHQPGLLMTPCVDDANIASAPGQTDVEVLSDNWVLKNVVWKLRVISLNVLELLLQIDLVGKKTWLKRV